jgi:hypothetical protein
MNTKNTICLLALACAFATGARAQEISSPTSEAETNARISNRAQLTSAPTIYIWMLDAEVEYDENNNPVKPLEYKNTTGDKNDNYYLVKLQGGSSYDTPISNNIIAKDPDCTNNVALRPNYGQWDNPKPDEYRLARIKVVDVTGSIKSRDELTTIRGRGNSTWKSPKKAYRLKFPSKTKFLAKEDGTNEYADAKNWTLLANVADKTMLRNSLASEIGRRIEDKTGVKGLPYYPAFKFVDVVLNNEYIGSYQISDHTQIQAERINIDEDNGWLLEGVSTNDAFIDVDAHVTVNGLVVNVKNPEDDLYENAKADIESYLGTVHSLAQWSDWVSGDFSEATGFFKYVDLESVVAYFIGNEISGNYDGLISNYAYRDINPGDKLKMGPLWDFDIAFGNFGNLKEGFIFDAGKIDYGFLPEIARNLTKHSPEFVKLLVERWDKVYSYQPENRPEGSTLGQYDYPVDNGVSNYLWHRIFRIPDETKQSFALNYTPKENGGAGWKTTEDYLYWVGGTFDSYDEACTSMWHFIVDHNHWLNTAIHLLKENMMASDYTHDATSTATSLGDHDGKICKTTVINRTFTVGEWNTICLPFSLTKEKLQATFGDDVVLMEYKSIANNQMQFAEVADKRLAAGVPYLIKPSKVEKLVFDEVALSCPNPATVSYADNTAYAFKGTYFKSSIADGTTMLLDAANEQFKANSSVSSLDGCSAYIVCPAGTTTVPIFSTVSFPDDQDNTALLADLSGKTIDLTLTGRTFYHDGSWNTLCLPFDITDYTGTPLEGATVMQFKKKDTSFSGSTLTIGFSEPNSVKAGKPYLVKWTDGAGDVKDPTFRNVTISATEPGSYEATDVFMLGTFSPVTLRAGDTQKLYLGGGNTLYYPQNDVPVNACRAYFELQGELTAGDVESSDLVRSCVLNFDGQETAISEIYSVTKASAVDNSWYTLDGRRLSSEPTAPGIYINRGRKIIIK